MSDEEFEKYLKLIQSMTLDCQMDGITKETYLLNLTGIVEQMNEKANA